MDEHVQYRSTFRVTSFAGAQACITRKGPRCWTGEDSAKVLPSKKTCPWQSHFVLPFARLSCRKHL